MNDPVSPEYIQQMNDLAKFLDDIFNGDGPRKVGFALLVMDLEAPEGGRVNYISNSQRESVRIMMKEMLARWEGQPLQKGHG